MDSWNTTLKLGIGIGLFIFLWMSYRPHYPASYLSKQNKNLYLKNDNAFITSIKEGEAIIPFNSTAVHFDSLTATERSSYLSADLNLNPNDQHNVHNITISEKVRESVKLLKQLYGKNLITFTKIKTNLRRTPAFTRKYPHLLEVISFIDKSNAAYSHSSIPEKIILELVFTRIFDQINKPRLSQLVKEILHQLNDCFEEERDAVCCLEGRIVRYFQTLELYDHDPTSWCLIPLWYYKTQIENNCSRQLDDMINNLPFETQVVYFKINPNQQEQKIVSDLNDKLVAELDDYFDREYGSKINQKQLAGILEPCFNAIKGL